MIAAIYAGKDTEQNGVADEARSMARQIEHAKSLESPIEKIMMQLSAFRCLLAASSRHSSRPPEQDHETRRESRRPPHQLAP
jgi:hypothetical protein